MPISKVHLIPYSEKLSREKTFANFAVLWLYAKVFSAKFGAWRPLARQKQAICESFSAKIVFFTNLQKFSPLKVYHHTITRVYGILAKGEEVIRNCELKLNNNSDVAKVKVVLLLKLLLVQVQCLKFEKSPSGQPSVNFSCVDLSEAASGFVNVTVNLTMSGRDSADFYLINITSNAPQIPYGGLLNITASLTQLELTGFMAGYEYNITVRGVTANCGGLVGRESEPLTIRPQGMSQM